TELAITNEVGGAYTAQLDWVARYVEHSLSAVRGSEAPTILQQSAIRPTENNKLDVVITDPPYYDAIPYSDLMDFFYIWLRRTLSGASPEVDEVFAESLAPKWNRELNDGELIDDESRFDGNREASKRSYEDGMARAFKASCD